MDFEVSVLNQIHARVECENDSVWNRITSYTASKQYFSLLHCLCDIKNLKRLVHSSNSKRLNACKPRLHARDCELRSIFDTVPIPAPLRGEKRRVARQNAGRPREGGAALEPVYVSTCNVYTYAYAYTSRVTSSGARVRVTRRPRAPVRRETMGAEGAFDRRRIELAEISGRAAAAVTDEEVSHPTP